MLFKRLFLAMLAATALVGCSDNDIDPEIIDATKGDVIVTFAATGSNQVITKAAGESDVYKKIHDNFVSTSSVEEYCLMKDIDDKESVIDHLTVFIFDKENGDKLVKTAYFDAKNKKEITETNPEVKSESSSAGLASIYQFGGIVLKEGTYSFILAGNIKNEEDDLSFPSNEEGRTYTEYKTSALIKSKFICDTESKTTNLPMICFLDEVKLTAYNKPESGNPTATLNVIYNKDKVATPTSATDIKDVSIPKTAEVKSILLDRLVARVQLQKVNYEWTLEGAADFKISLLGAALVNAAEKSYINTAGNGTGSGGGMMNGSFTSDKTSWYKPVDTDTEKDATSMVFYDGNVVSCYKKDIKDVTLGNNKAGYTWSSNEETTDILPVSFYTYAKSGVPDGMNPNYELMLVLKCQVNDEKEPVYYYVPLRNGEALGSAAVEANKVYNISVTIKGDGSDVPGKKKEMVTPDIVITTGAWGYHEIGDDDPQVPVIN